MKSCVTVRTPPIVPNTFRLSQPTRNRRIVGSGGGERPQRPVVRALRRNVLLREELHEGRERLPPWRAHAVLHPREDLSVDILQEEGVRDEEEESREHHGVEDRDRGMHSAALPVRVEPRRMAPELVPGQDGGLLAGRVDDRDEGRAAWAPSE